MSDVVRMCLHIVKLQFEARTLYIFRKYIFIYAWVKPGRDIVHKVFSLFCLLHLKSFRHL